MEKNTLATGLTIGKHQLFEKFSDGINVILLRSYKARMPDPRPKVLFKLSKNKERIIIYVAGIDNAFYKINLSVEDFLKSCKGNAYKTACALVHEARLFNKISWKIVFLELVEKELGISLKAAAEETKLPEI